MVGDFRMDVKRQAQNAEHQALLKELLCALSATGLCRVWIQNTGTAFRDNFMIRFGIKGGGDITGVLIDGRRLEIEVKTGKANQNVNQKNFGEIIRRFNGVYLIARDVNSVVDFVKKEGERWLCNNSAK